MLYYYNSVGFCGFYWDQMDDPSVPHSVAEVTQVGTFSWKSCCGWNVHYSLSPSGCTPLFFWPFIILLYR